MYKQSSPIYHVEIVAKGIKGVSCRVVEGFIYHVWWGMLTGGLCWPNNFSLTTIPRAMQKKYATGRPDQKDLNENLAATQGLAHMIIECNRLFEVQEPARISRLDAISAAHSLCIFAVHLTLCFYASIRSLMRWLLSRVIHTWRLTCMRPHLASCASSLKMMMEHTKLIWKGGFRTCLKRPEKSPNTGCPAAALITQSSTVRRSVVFF